jgi:TadE-like protein
MSDPEAGTVTAELAITFPGVILLCVALLMTGQAVIGEVRCADAARAGARLAARGDSVAAVAAEVSRRAPPGALVGVSRSGGLLRVSVRAPLGGVSPRWAGLTVSGSATASVESSPSGPP